MSLGTEPPRSPGPACGARPGTGVPQSREPEFRRDAAGRDGPARRWFPEDMPAFADTTGGDLGIWRGESDGVAASLDPICIPPPDDAVRRLVPMLRDGLEPRPIWTRICSGRGSARCPSVAQAMFSPSACRGAGMRRIASSSGAATASAAGMRAAPASSVSSGCAPPSSAPPRRSGS